VSGRQFLVDGHPFFLKGVCYSPAPVGVNPLFSAPYGDFFTEEYEPLWHRDFELMTAMGVNAIRLYGWNTTLEASAHAKFLDVAHSYGLKVIVTYYLGTAKETNLSTSSSRSSVINAFARQAAQYTGHPALIGWSFGNELNGRWNGFLGAISESNDCGWNEKLYVKEDPEGCYYYNETSGACADAINCLYTNLFQFLDLAASSAKQAMSQVIQQHHQRQQQQLQQQQQGLHPTELASTLSIGSSASASEVESNINTNVNTNRNTVPHIVLTSWADVDNLESRLGAFESLAPHIDMWGAQLYRGKDFGSNHNDFLANFYENSKKPLVLTEFGIDAYNDPCGSLSDKSLRVCRNQANKPPPGNNFA
jgi:hypothetical protein